MKKTTMVGLVMTSAVLGIVWLVFFRAITACAQEAAEAAGANLAFPAETNPPPVNTLLDSSLPQEMDPASPFGQLVRLVQAGVDKNVILAYVAKSPRFFEIDADDIIYLTDLGTPPEIIEAILEHDQRLMEQGIGAGTPPPIESGESISNPPPEVTVDYFYDTLAPYGGWVYIEGYGRCWRPSVVVYNSSWRPYCDNGHWIYTDHGWYWKSNYSWGWATFHYGRWFNHSRYGWCWWPDTVWAPSWVHWRYNRSYCGWAPLPPYAEYRSGIGLVYRGSKAAVGFTFGLNVNSFTFVATKDFCDRDPWRHQLDPREAARVYDGTTLVHHIDYDTKKRSIINSGIPPREIAEFTHKEIRPVSIRRDDDRFARDARKPNSGSTSRPANPSTRSAAPEVNGRIRQGGSSQSGRASSSGRYHSTLGNPPAGATKPDGRSDRRAMPETRQTQTKPVVPQQQGRRKEYVPAPSTSSSPSSNGAQNSNRSYSAPKGNSSRKTKPEPVTKPQKSNNLSNSTEADG